ncbi:MAG: hypothetical protein C4567_01420 [Deltaproteobacteria bacterium]|nr:MAG: hypothetical protein C4567_01420 [Deltaproteobacteria bacterium]
MIRLEAAIFRQFRGEPEFFTIFHFLQFSPNFIAAKEKGGKKWLSGEICKEFLGPKNMPELADIRLPKCRPESSGRYCGYFPKRFKKLSASPINSLEDIRHSPAPKSGKSRLPGVTVRPIKLLREKKLHSRNNDSSLERLEELLRPGTILCFRLRT